MRTLSNSRRPFSRLTCRGWRRNPALSRKAFCLWREQPSWALRQSLLSRSQVSPLPCPCLPLLHGHYPASSLLRRLCHLLGAVLRTCLADHERRRCSQIVIPDSRRNAFLPFRSQPPSVLHSVRTGVSRSSRPPRSAFAELGGSRLRHGLADSSKL